jgi:rhamnose utilization protein RhaD (predicted bifunctional aldolase and dehydrogenase)
MKKTFSPNGNQEGLETLIKVSREYGSDPDFVLAGGGNTSYKSDGRMFVKASGTQLGTIEADGFSEMDLEKLNRIWSGSYSDDMDKREEQVLADLMSSRVDPESRRPSVETLLHGLFPYTWVIHTHPAGINGITCSRRGEEAARKVFGNDILWIPVIDPGYILALEVKKGAEAYREASGLFPSVVILQNHGIFIADDSLDEVSRKYKGFLGAIEDITGEVKAELQISPAGLSDWVKSLEDIKPDHSVISFGCEAMNPYLKDREAFQPLSESPTPDHIVYSGYRPLWAESGDDLKEISLSFEKEEGFFPRIIAVKGKGFLCCHESESKADTAARLFLDHLKIALTAEFFGGLQFMPVKNVNFIRNWEVEKYRASLSK